MTTAVKTAEKNLTKNGFLDIDLDPELDLVAEINRLKKEKNAIILAHYYQESEIQDIADYIGDSLGLSQKAADTDADIIVFAGVHFMAETAKMLSPHKKVLLPDLKAGCSLADSCPPHLFRKFKEKHPDAVVVSYINCTAELKTLTDICCTSTNSVHIIESIPKDKQIIFAPDKNLGAYLKKKTGRDLILWNGACMVHEIFSHEKITKLKSRHPGALLIAHPECELASPHKTFFPAPPNNTCACNECPHMKRNTMEKLYLCMEHELPEIILEDWVIEQGVKSINRMLEISEKAGLGLNPKRDQD